MNIQQKRQGRKIIKKKQEIKYEKMLIIIKITIMM